MKTTLKFWKQQRVVSYQRLLRRIYVRKRSLAFPFFNAVPCWFGYLAIEELFSEIVEVSQAHRCHCVIVREEIDGNASCVFCEKSSMHFAWERSFDDERRRDYQFPKRVFRRRLGEWTIRRKLSPARETCDLFEKNIFWIYRRWRNFSLCAINRKRSTLIAKSVSHRALNRLAFCRSLFLFLFFFLM